MGERLRVLDLFSGIGGFSLGLERTGGFRTVAFCEIEEFPRRVLAKHWPGVPIHRDVRELKGEHVGAVDVICGGFPCQDISLAGPSEGLAGKRSGLWSEYARLVGELRPGYIIVENVAALLGRGISVVLGDLAALGYDAEWDCVPASELGAPHIRDRVWIVAYPGRTRRSRLVESLDPCTPGPWRVRGAEDMQLVADAPFVSGDRWPQPLVRRMDDGVPDRTHRLRALGNAVVPQIPEIIGRAILEARGIKRATSHPAKEQT